MNGIILYQSKYGATRKYAQWLKDKTGFACVETKRADIEQVEKYDTIILGGGVYASGVAGLSFLRKHYSRLKGRKMIVFCVGASPYDPKGVEQAAAHNLKDDLKEIPFFYCRGAWDEESMGLTDRALCKLLHKAVAKKDPSTFEPWMAALMSAVGKKCDWTDEKYLEPVLRELGL